MNLEGRLDFRTKASCVHFPQDKSFDTAPSCLNRVFSVYLRVVKSVSRGLFERGWIISHYIIGSVWGEPKAQLLAIVSRIRGWKAAWRESGFYDAGDQTSLKQAKIALEKSEKIKRPLILFHGVHSDPTNWLYWLSTLREARDRGEIGHVFTLQLANEMPPRMKQVREVIDRVTQLYEDVYHQQISVNLLGFSRGGWAAHIASFADETLHDHEKIERRWHCADKRNPKVYRVVSVAAPTWLCLEGQKEEGNRFMYPKQEFSQSEKDRIAKTHPHLYDIVGRDDMNAFEPSQLASNHIYVVDHGHLGMTQCPEVCRLALDLLYQPEF